LTVRCSNNFRWINNSWTWVSFDICGKQYFVVINSLNEALKYSRFPVGFVVSCGFAKVLLTIKNKGHEMHAEAMTLAGTSTILINID